MQEEISNNASPRLARFLMERCLPGHLRSAVIGDIEEIFSTVVRQRGRHYASGWYWNQACQSVFAHFFSSVRAQLGDVQSEFESAARSLVRHRRYSVISIAGLALAVTCCLLIALYISHELSFDSYHKNADRIFQVHSGRIVNIPGLLAAGIVEQNPHVEKAGVIFRPSFGRSSIIKYGERTEEADGLLFGNSELFEVFSWRFVSRTSWPPLDKPFTVVVTESAAARMFGHRDPVGDTVEIANHYFTVSGVIEDIPANSHFTFEYMASVASADSVLHSRGDRATVNSWQFNSVFTYLLLDNPASAGSVARQLAVLQAENAESPLSDFSLRPLSDVYFARDVNLRLGGRGNTSRIAMFAAAFILMLVIAGINVANLVTAAWRMDGGNFTGENLRRRWFGLFRRFAGETFLIAALAVTIALLAARLLLPLFNDLIEKQLGASTGLVPWVIAGTVLFPIAVSVLAALLAALRAGRREDETRREGESRGVLVARSGRLPVAFQLLVAFVMVLSMVALIQQVSFIQHKPRGFQAKGLLVIPVDAGRMDVKKMDELRKSLMELPGVESITVSATVPGKPIVNSRMPDMFDPDTGEQVRAHFLEADRAFVDTYGITKKTGIMEYPPWQPVCLVNETLARAAGWENTDEAPGQDLVISMNRVSLPVAGVVGDFHFFTTQRAIQPLLVIVNNGVKPSYVSVRLDDGCDNNTVARVTGRLDRIQPGAAHFPYFMDQFIENGSSALTRMRNQYLILTLVILVIALFGLLGYGTFVVQSRREEIFKWRHDELRPLWWILFRLDGVAAALTIAAASLAVPVSIYLTDRWLSVYAYRSEPATVVYLVAASVLVLAGMVFVCVPAVRFTRATGPRSLHRFSSFPAAE